jgi:hypothetical protein
VVFRRSQIGRLHRLDFCVTFVCKGLFRPKPEARGRGRESPILGIVALSEHSFVFLSLPPVYLGFLVYPAECSEVPYKLREKSGKAPLDARVRLS